MNRVAGLSNGRKCADCTNGAVVWMDYDYDDFLGRIQRCPHRERSKIYYCRECSPYWLRGWYDYWTSEIALRGIGHQLKKVLQGDA